MITESKPSEGSLPAATRRSDQPYSSLTDLTKSEAAAEPDLRSRAPRITRDEVFATADSLLVEGARPTIDRVRMRLGRGSPNTINDHLDAWWLKLGSRLRDLPGREFPQLPERVAGSLQRLWNEALDAAHEVLQSTLARREEALVGREQALQSEREALERDQLFHAARATEIESGFVLAREQLDEANRRARVLEDALEKRDEEVRQAVSELKRLELDFADARTLHAQERAEALAERQHMAGRYEANEARWLTEIDRARQAIKVLESAVREQKVRLERSVKERDEFRSEVHALRGQLSTASAVREQLEARLHAAVGSQPPQRIKGTRVKKSTIKGRARVLRSKS